MKPSFITTEPTDMKETSTESFMDLLSAAFQSQSLGETNKEQRPKRTSRQLSSPALRKRSSGSYRTSQQQHQQQQQQQQDFPTERRRDSNGVNYTNCVSLLNEYQHSKEDKKDDEKPTFTLRRGEEPTQPISPKNNSTTTNRGRIAKRLSATLNTISPIHSNPHMSSSNNSSFLKSIKDTKYIGPNALAQLLTDAQTPLGIEPLMIDMRPLEQYQKSHIRHSIHVNVPTLLIKRYRRGVVSNFNLESFITTPEGTDLFRHWLKQFNAQDIQELPERAHFVVYDEQMTESDMTTATWILVGAIKKNTLACVQYLQHGYRGFEQFDLTHKYLEGSQFARLDTPPLPIPSSSQSSELTKKFKHPLFNPPNKLKMPTPMISRSASTLSAKANNLTVNVQRRASLFTLDTNMRPSKSRSLTSIPSQSQSTQRHKNELESIHEKNNHTPTTQIFSPEEVYHTPLETTPPSDDEIMVTAQGEQTPKTENEYDFVISEIIPNFLYLGPEIATVDQVSGLKARSIRRILNMAEECDDDVPGLKQDFQYQKIAARDTVEMQNVEDTLRKAVNVIDDSKKNHEPIYVHCKAGKSRSAAAILAYLVLIEHWTLKKAYRHIVKMRPNISPNIGFVVELMKLEEGVHGGMSNFAGTDWRLIDLTNPPSPDTQREMGRLERAWKRGRSTSNASRHLSNSLLSHEEQSGTNSK
ncbi:uncharacterized protein B0P05DRAFT_635802 [Gilbertella persicaria]|uniref:protein-tyrosine-phosphatase n=1 Tax=Rhizopus stolonifer TaxID=4846 RepID=A0A367KKS3_RHIST|nr:uncharacterized protein B0P05DRAFT_635802 [Gilbertella persicaria]KAI8085843.1 hypothetical protein B0P05DRAFT_635802 [Gilbertella persicaria]RCI02796.1 hypothetical protein CU098_008117 [Rhizopus stolonifer]